MIQSLLSAVRAEASGERALESVRALARFHRIQSSPGYERAAQWLIAALERIGLSPEVERVPGDGRTRFLGQLQPEGWECTHARAAIVGDAGARLPVADFDAQPLSIVQRSVPVRGRFPIVVPRGAGGDAADYEGIDVRGAVVLVSAGAHPAHRRAVIERGAAGLLVDGRRLVPPVRDAFDDPDQVAYTSFWWSGDEPRGWGVVVSPRCGAGLRERIAAGERLALEVEIESRRFAAEIPLVTASLPGSEPGEILVLGHLCHPMPGANDNASGASAVLETARTLGTLVERGQVRLRRGVRFLWMPELTGTLAWLGRDPSRAGRLTAAINLDMVGEDQEACGSTFLLERPPCFAASFAETLLARIRTQAPDWVESFSGPGHYSMTRMAEVPYSGGSDHAALLDPSIGVPCPLLIQWPDRFYHSSHDSPDRCDPRSLALAVRCAATYAGFLASAGPAEAEWLLAAVAREARVRLLRAMDEADPPTAIARERVRGATTIASLARLGVGERALGAARAGLEAFADREAAPATARPPEEPASAGAHRVPRRRQRGMLDFLWRLLEGVDRLAPDESAALGAFERTAPGGTTFFDLAWFACDGRRSIAEIAELVRLETGRASDAEVAGFFEWMDRLGLATLEAGSGKEAAWSTSAPATDTP